MENTLEQPKRNKRLIPIIATLVFLALCYAGFKVYHFLNEPNVPTSLESDLVRIPSGSGLEEVVSILKNGHFILDERSFRLMAERMKYKVRAGQFKLKPGWSNRDLVRHLRAGKQEPVKLILVNERLPEHVAAKAARFIEADSLSIINLLNDTTFLDSIGYSPQTVMSLFIPNTYEFFWNTPSRKFIERMINENGRFWNNDNRKEKANALNLTPTEVYTLASIVERETNNKKDKPLVAGLYFNRLQIGMPLQADPTLVFASKDWESRSIAKYKALDSPYNTYMYAGLSSRPISMATIPSLDAVLNMEKHDYIYMCAAGDESGLHNFAETYDGHLKNIEIYKRNLRKRGLL